MRTHPVRWSLRGEACRPPSWARVWPRRSGDSGWLWKWRVCAGPCPLYIRDPEGPRSLLAQKGPGSRRSPRTPTSPRGTPCSSPAEPRATPNPRSSGCGTSKWGVGQAAAGGGARDLCPLPALLPAPAHPAARPRPCPCVGSAASRQRGLPRGCPWWAGWPGHARPQLPYTLFRSVLSLARCPSPARGQGREGPGSLPAHSGAGGAVTGGFAPGAWGPALTRWGSGCWDGDPGRLPPGNSGTEPLRASGSSLTRGLPCSAGTRAGSRGRAGRWVQWLQGPWSPQGSREPSPQTEILMGTRHLP